MFEEVHGADHVQFYMQELHFTFQGSRFLITFMHNLDFIEPLVTMSFTKGDLFQLAVDNYHIFLQSLGISS